MTEGEVVIGCDYEDHNHWRCVKQLDDLNDVLTLSEIYVNNLPVDPSSIERINTFEIKISNQLNIKKNLVGCEIYKITIEPSYLDVRNVSKTVDMIINTTCSNVQRAVLTAENYTAVVYVYFKMRTVDGNNRLKIK